MIIFCKYIADKVDKGPYSESCFTKLDHIHSNIEAVDWGPGKEKDQADRGQDPAMNYEESEKIDLKGRFNDYFKIL